jgi:hypothetical protein
VLSAAFLVGLTVCVVFGRIVGALLRPLVFSSAGAWNAYRRLFKQRLVRSGPEKRFGDLRCRPRQAFPRPVSSRSG